VFLSQIKYRIMQLSPVVVVDTWEHMVTCLEVKSSG